MRWTREEYLALMTGQDVGREMFCELFGPLIGLEEEWKRQGASPAELDLSAFGFDWVEYAWLPVDTGPRSGIVPRVLEDTPDHTLSVDAYGRTAKLLKGAATIPLPQGYPVRTMDDWLRVKPWYAFDESRVDMARLRALKAVRDRGTLLLCSVPGAFDEPRQLMGEEELCVAYYEQPELIEDLLSTIADTANRCFERMCAVVPPDCLCVHEDFAGKSGPLAGPRQVDAFFRPYYCSVWEPLRAAGAKLLSQDSDGDITPVIPALRACGVNVFYPCEPAAGMDILALRQKYGRAVAFKGGIDKHVLRGTRAEIDAELDRKLSEPLRHGGTVFALDHRIPNGTPLENYRYYVRSVRERLGMPPAQSAPHVRMAF